MKSLWSVLDDLKASDSTASRENRNIEWIKKALEFDGMDNRKRRVQKAASDTFRWCISNDEIPDDHPKLEKSLKAWLNDGGGVYHITGKPGSGKSTLMKLIDYSIDAEDQLKQWASRDGKRLIRASFYAWRAADANRLQNQSEGLMRTLLHQVLTQAPELVKEIFPRYWGPERFSRAEIWSQSSPGRHKLELEAQEIHDAMESILKMSKDIQLFLLIDGMDEFANESEQWELARRVLSWTACARGSVAEAVTTCKVCVSSREEGVFLDTFSESLRLRLHLVTQADVQELVTTRLRANDRFSSAPQDKQQQLIECAVRNAEGVFLWVCLVIEELKLQLNEERKDLSVEGDFTSLLTFVEKSPQDLNDFFKDILARIRQHHRSEAADIFTIALALNGHRLRDFFLLFHYSLVRSCPTGITELRQHLLETMTPEEVLTRERDFTTRLPSLCKGLLETQPTSINYHKDMPVLNSASNQTLGFIHRSAYEFFRDQPETLNTMAHKGTPVQATVLIVQSLVKACNVIPRDNPLQLEHEYYFDRMLKYLFDYLHDITAKVDDTTVLPYLGMLEAVLLRKQEVISDNALFNKSLNSKDVRLLPDTACLVLRMAMAYDYSPYIEWALKNYPTWLFSNESKVWLVRGFIGGCTLPTSTNKEACRNLVKKDWFSVNEYFFANSNLIPEFSPPLSGSLWLNALVNILLQSSARQWWDRRDAKRWALLIKEYIDLGAEPRIQFQWWSGNESAHSHDLQCSGKEDHPIVSIQENPVYRNTEDWHKEPLTTGSIWCPPSESLSLGSSFGLTIMFGDGHASEQIIQGPQWQVYERDTQIVRGFITNFGKTSSSATLRDVLDQMITMRPFKDHHEAYRKEQEASALIIMNKIKLDVLGVLDKAIDRFQAQSKAPEVAEVLDNASQDEIETATVAEPDQDENNHALAHLDNTSVVLGCLETLHDLLLRYHFVVLMCLGKATASLVKQMCFVDHANGLIAGLSLAAAVGYWWEARKGES